MVLQARYKAEEVWYAVVGEKEKELPNVIDYNIKPEITKDTSAVENANNDTTTGMADVIPWINAPKLRAETSIAWSANQTVVVISDYTSIDERQPIVDRILAWEFVVPLITYTPYSSITRRYMIPITSSDNYDRIRFQSIWVWTQWVRANCWITNGQITSVTFGNWSI